MKVLGDVEDIRLNFDCSGVSDDKIKSLLEAVSDRMVNDEIVADRFWWYAMEEAKKFGLKMVSYGKNNTDNS